MQFSIRPTFNPSGRYAGADFTVEQLEGDGGLLLIYDPLRFQPEVNEFLCAIQCGLTEYATDPPSDFGVLPTARFIVNSLDVHPNASDIRAFRIVGAFAAREFHKRYHCQL